MAQTNASPRVVSYAAQNHKDSLSVIMARGQHYVAHTNRNTALEVFGRLKDGPHSAGIGFLQLRRMMKDADLILRFEIGRAPFFYRLLEIGPEEAAQAKAGYESQQKPGAINLSRD